MNYSGGSYYRNLFLGIIKTAKNRSTSAQNKAFESDYRFPPQVLTFSGFKGLNLSLNGTPSSKFYLINIIVNGQLNSRQPQN